MEASEGESGSRRGGADLLERAAQCAQLEAALASARAGEGRIAAIEGDAGIGKSRLLRWTADRARSDAMTVCSVRIGHHERELSYGAVVGLFERRLAQLDGPARADVLSGPAALAAPLFDERRWRGALDEPPDALAHGLFWLTVNLATRMPLLLAVDDLQWCDAASLRALLHIAHRVDELPLAMVVTRRSGEPETSPLADELIAQPVTSTLRLQPLSASAVEHLLLSDLDALPEPAFAGACLQATGGNPFLLHAVARSLREDGIDPSDGNIGRIASLRPAGVTQHALVRIARQGPDAVELAAAVAVLGDGAGIDEAADLAGLDSAAAVRAGDALAASGILAGGEPLQFTHPLLRAVVYDELPANRRAAQHLRAAELLRSRDAPSAAVAAHLLRTTAEADWISSTLRDAASAAQAAGDPESAVSHLSRALRRDLARAERAALLLELGRAEAAIGDERAQAHLDEAVALHAGDPHSVAMARLRAGESLLGRGDRLGAAHQFEQGLEALDGRDELLARDLHAGYFSAASLVPELAARALEHVAPLLAAQPGGETPLERTVLAVIATHRATTGRGRAETIALARRAWGEGALLRDASPATMTWALVTAGLAWSDEFCASLEVTDRVLDHARRHGLRMLYANASYVAQMPSWMCGDIEDSLAFGEAALDARTYGWDEYAAAAAAIQALVLVDRGEEEQASRLIDGLGDGRYDRADWAFALAARGRLTLIAGRPADALPDLLAAGEVFAAVGFQNSTIAAPWRSDAAIARHQLGDDVAARRLVDEDLERARVIGTPTQIAHSLRAAAALAPTPPAAVALLREASEALADSEARLERLRTAAELGRALRRAGERREARLLLERVHDEARQMGARRILRHVREELRVAGARPRRLSFSGTESLTAGQRRVCLMAADGMSNRDIAQALFVTPRTVEQHLYNAYKKLGIASRAQLAEALTAPG